VANVEGVPVATFLGGIGISMTGIMAGYFLNRGARRDDVSDDNKVLVIEKLAIHGQRLDTTERMLGQLESLQRDTTTVLNQLTLQLEGIRIAVAGVGPTEDRSRGVLDEIRRIVKNLSETQTMDRKLTSDLSDRMRAIELSVAGRGASLLPTKLPSEGGL